MRARAMWRGLRVMSLLGAGVLLLAARPARAHCDTKEMGAGVHEKYHELAHRLAEKD